MKWTTKDGKKLDPKDMETSHIKNCLAMLKRNGFVSELDIQSFFCSPHNGDMAEYYWEQEMAEIFSRPVAPIIDEFEEELRRRK